MNYIDATIEMKIKEDGNPKFEIVLPQIVEWTCSIDASNVAVIRKDVQYWDEIDDFWKFRDIARVAHNSNSPYPFNAPYIRGVNKHDANYVFDEDKSVKWNRNAVIEYNKTVDSIQAKNKKFQKNADDIFNSCAEACIRSVFISAGLKINTDEIEYIIAKAKEHDYDYDYELVDRIEIYCDFYVELLKKRKEN